MASDQSGELFAGYAAVQFTETANGTLANEDLRHGSLSGFSENLLG